MAVFLVIVILVVLIVVHELGHFIVAKILGVRVDEFGIGYPPRAYTLGKIGETEYTLNWLPFGGFVRLFGENGETDGNSREGKRSLANASPAAQAAILIAGVAANALFAWVLFTGSFMSGMLTTVPPDTPNARILVSSVIPRSPAEQAGLAVGDELISIAGTSGDAPSATTPLAVTEFVRDHGGKELVITYQRDGVEQTVTATPVHAVLDAESGRPALGVALTSVAELRLPLVDAAARAASHTVDSFKVVGSGLWNLLRDAVTGNANLASVVGPVGLVNVVGESTTYGFGYLLGLAAFISVNLAIINLIPIPALDGGRLVFVAIEAVTRRSATGLVVRLLNLLGFSLIILLMIAVTYNDIVRLVG